MTDVANRSAAASTPGPWPDTLTRVPFWAFQRDDVYAAEQSCVFRGAAWHYLCLEGDIPEPGDQDALGT